MIDKLYLQVRPSSFDEVQWDLVLRAVRAVTDCRWVLLYVDRWLRAPCERVPPAPRWLGAGSTVRVIVL